MGVGRTFSMEGGNSGFSRGSKRIFSMGDNSSETSYYQLGNKEESTYLLIS